MHYFAFCIDDNLKVLILSDPDLKCIHMGQYYLCKDLESDSLILQKEEDIELFSEYSLKAGSPVRKIMFKPYKNYISRNKFKVSKRISISFDEKGMRFASKIKNKDYLFIYNFKGADIIVKAYENGLIVVIAKGRKETRFFKIFEALKGFFPSFDEVCLPSL